MAKKILVVEDDAGYQELFGFVLAAYEVTVCPSIEEAMGKMDAQPFDLILCDINLMGMSGLELLSKVRQDGLVEKIPFILCSSQFDEATKKRAMEEGAAGFVVKPFQTEALQSLIKNFLTF